MQPLHHPLFIMIQFPDVWTFTLLTAATERTQSPAMMRADLGPIGCRYDMLIPLYPFFDFIKFATSLCTIGDGDAYR